MTELTLPIPYGRQDITAADEQAVLEVLRSDFLTQGPAIAGFEEAFAKYIGCNYAVAVSNGTTALHLACIALGVKKGTKVLTTPITFAASANAVLYCGGEVEFVDINEKTFCIDPDLLEAKLKANPGVYSGIIPVDMAGHPADLVRIRKLADQYGLWVLEDACHAPGATYAEGKHRCGDGTHADIAVFSFHPVKHIACGEGGMITTNNKAHYERMKVLRTHGIVREPSLMRENHGPWYHEMQELGFNYRLPDVLCALGSSQLKMADERLAKRREIARTYDQKISNPLIQTPVNAQGVEHAYHLYVVRTYQRKDLFMYLREFQIYAQVHYIPVYKHPYWAALKNWPACPVAEKYYSECISLPMFPTLSEEQLSFVLEKLNEFRAN